MTVPRRKRLAATKLSTRRRGEECGAMLRPWSAPRALASALPRRVPFCWSSNPRLQRTRLRSPLSRKPLGAPQ